MINFFSKRLNKKGFTLAELLIVVAIIAILVAIAIPMFTSQLNKAKVARDQANMRAIKAAAIAILLDDDTTDFSQETWYATGTFDADTYDLVKVEIAGDGVDNNEAGQINYKQPVIIEIKGLDIGDVDGGD